MWRENILKIQEFFKWTNPWLYGVGLLLITVIWIIVPWRKIKKRAITWWNEPMEEGDDEEDDWENESIKKQPLIEKLKAYGLERNGRLLTEEELQELIELIKSPRYE